MAHKGYIGHTTAQHKKNIARKSIDTKAGPLGFMASLGPSIDPTGSFLKKYSNLNVHHNFFSLCLGLVFYSFYHQPKYVFLLVAKNKR